MYCPNCGTKTSSDQNFCRACGLGLEKIALSLNEQLPARADTNPLEQKERLEKLGVALLSVFGFGVLTIILYSVVSRLMISGGSLLSVLAMLGLIIMFASGLASVILFAKAKDAGEAATKRQPQQIPSTEGGSTKELLTEGHFEPVPSVTDRTTELLTIDKHEGKR
ncbi:MAG TPA: zinc ribbon domain-containing protein [Pyrinomonadaceae bacterium]|nr:zinc ribbon domain-containing protein [Pyrinomonadaceae bacterium]